MVKVALTRGQERYGAIMRALKLIQEEVPLPDRPVLIKPNCVSPHNELAATPVDALRATMEFLQGLGVKKFLLGEASAQSGDTMGAFQRFGYFSLKERYDVEFLDLNQDAWIKVQLVDRELGPVEVRISRTMAEAYRVSVARMKTHNRVVATLSVKNIMVGAILNADRHLLCHEPRAINLSLVRLHQLLPPHLAVIDGVVGMEGEGPTEGTAIASGVVVASAHAVAADTVGARVMGFDPDRIGHLWYWKRLHGFSDEQIEVIGERVEDCALQYKPHSTYQEQLQWQVPQWEEVLARVCP